MVCPHISKNKNSNDTSQNGIKYQSDYYKLKIN